MILTNSMLQAAARNQLRGSWLTAVGLTLLFGILTSIASALAGIGLLIIEGPLLFGYYSYFIRKVRNEPAAIENLFDGFKLFGSNFLLFLLEFVLIALWSLLLVIPGIIKTLSYSMAYFILRDNPQMNALEAITASRMMMNGYKTKLFCLYLSFIGWAILCVLSFGIGFLWLTPYMTLSVANFYENLKQEQGTQPLSLP